MDINDLPSELAALYRYWSDKGAGRPAPPRSEIDPVEVPALLGNIVLIDVRPDLDRWRAERFVYRLIGAKISLAVGSELTGQSVAEVQPPHVSEALTALYERVIDTVTPQVSRYDRPLANGVWADFTSLALPLSTDGRSVDKLLVGVAFQESAMPH